MEDRILVYGKAQNRTALGISKAYLTMYPNATLEALRNAFPGNLNQRVYGKFYNHLYYDLNQPIIYDTGKNKGNEITKESKEFDFFIGDDEILKLKDGTRVVINKMWVKEDFERIVERAKKFGIKTADYKPTKPFEKGGYILEYLNGYLPPVEEVSPKKSKLLWWVLLLIILIIIIVAYLYYNQ